MAEGITKRGGKYQAWVWDGVARKKVYKSFDSEKAAKSWRADAKRAIDNGLLRAQENGGQTLEQAWDEWIEKARGGAIRKRGGQSYKPAVLREYDRNMRNRVLPVLGKRKATDIDRITLLRFKEQLMRGGFDGTTLTNTFRPLQALYRRLQDFGIPNNPTRDLGLPIGYNRRERVAEVGEAWQLIDALPECDRALWATAFFAGLRRGELRALRVCDINGVIRVERSWDDVEGVIPPKSEKGVREVPLPEGLRKLLQAHIMRTGRRGEDLVFGTTAKSPFMTKTIRLRAKRAWAVVAIGCFIQQRPGTLEPITLHEARHTYVSLMLNAGEPLERVGDYVGHSTVYMVDKYRHLLRDDRANAAAKLDALLTRS